MAPAIIITRQSSSMKPCRSIWYLCIIILSLISVRVAVRPVGYALGGRVKGRINVCAHTRYIRRPVHVRQRYQRPVQETDYTTCARKNENPCNRTIITYRPAYRYIMKIDVRKQIRPSCCPGWKQRTPNDTDCPVSQCSKICENGGQCVGVETCVCPKGYVGQYCNIDLDECSGRHKCQQKCINLPGTYECACASGFKLADDNRTCELCLTCTTEFKALETQVVTLPNKMETMMADMAHNSQINVQADMMAEMKKQSETFDKLQSQYDSIQELRKKMDVLPGIFVRLDNLTSLHEEVASLKLLGTDVNSLEERFDEAMADVKGSHMELSGSVEDLEERFKKRMAEQSERQSLAMNVMQQQMTTMAATLARIEQEKDDLQANLTSALEQYQETVSSLSREATSATTTQTQVTTTNPYAQGKQNDAGAIPYDRLASLSQQISILEEKMAECMCGQNYFG